MKSRVRHHFWVFFATVGGSLGLMGCAMKIQGQALPDFLNVYNDERRTWEATVGPLGDFEREIGFQHDAWTARHMAFWIQVYSRWSVRQGVIHDAQWADRIYETLDFTGMDGRQRRRKVLERRTYWKQVLLNVHAKRMAPESLNGDERHAFELLSDDPSSGRFLEASRRKRIRFQLGQKERFYEALVESGQYLQKMEEIFESEGVPRALTRIPFVESSFNVKALSKVQAAGVWQFIKSTGKVYLRIDDVIDERNDPWLAGRGAARLLRQNHESLRSWPLAVMAYNHGRMGLVRAVRQLGSNDYHDVIREFRGKRFGFASRNFFMEFMAAVEIERNASTYFPGIVRKTPIPTFEIKLPRPLSLPRLVLRLGLDRPVLRQLNPAIEPAIWSGARPMPDDVLMRIPRAWAPLDEDPRVVFFDRFFKTFGKR